MNRILLWALSTITVLVLLFGYRTSTSGPSEVSVASALPAISGSVSPPATSAPATSAPATSTPSTSTPGTSATHASAPPTTAPTTRTHSVTGPVAQTQWGPVQVEVTVAGSTISDVSVVQYPSGNATDAEINSYALPILIRSTLDQQSAKIDMVSGATITSQGYLTSLQAALDQALP